MSGRPPGPGAPGRHPRRTLFRRSPKAYAPAVSVGAPLNFWFSDVAASGSAFGTLTETQPANAPTSVGWVEGTATGYSPMTWNVYPQPTASFGVTALPNNPPGTNDCLRTVNQYTGTFTAGSWAIGLWMAADGVSGATIAIRFRVWRSADPLGQTGVTEITAGAVEGNTIVISSSGSRSAATASLASATLSGEYLFLQIACHSIGPGTSLADSEAYTVTTGGAEIVTPVFTSGAGPATINGAFSQTLGALTIAAAGTVAVTGSSSPILGALTSSSAGAVSIAASESSTLGAATMSSAGTVASAGISGALAVTLGAMTESSAGTLAIAGAEASTLGTATSSSTGTLAIAAAEVSTLGTATTASTGALAIAASESSTLGALSLSSAGTTQPAGNTGTVAVNFDPLTAVSAGAVNVTATDSSTLGSLSALAAGAVDIVAASPMTLGALALQASDAAPVDVIPIIGGGGEYHEPEQQQGEVIAVATITFGAMTCSGSAVIAPIPAIEPDNIPVLAAPIADFTPVFHAANASLTLDSIVVVGTADAKPMPITRRFPLAERVSRVKMAAKVPRFPR